MTAGVNDFDELPLSAVLRVNARCDAFESELRAGRTPQVKDHLGDATGAERETLIRQLTLVDSEYRGVSVAEFTRRLSEEGILPDDMPADPSSAAGLADRLVTAGALTPYQARTLLGPHPHPLALDDYLIRDRVAAGGMGTVYRAVHRRMKRVVALKVFADCRGDAATRGNWFRHEIEAAGKLSHPNVVTAYDAGEARGVAYLVSEFVDGTDLHRRVADHGPLTVAEAIRAVRDAAAGLAHAHECGLVHRDVKPSNLIRTPEGVVRVLDVGLARLAGPAVGESAVVVGTPGYMAPEQATSPDRVDGRADVYGLGCTLFYLLTGRPPLPGATAADRLAAHQTADPPPLPGVPVALGRLYARIVARSPDNRPGTMAEVVAALDAMAAPRSGRRRVLTFGAVAGIVAVVALGIRPGGSVPSPPPTTAVPTRPALRTVPFDAAAYQTEWAAALGIPAEIEPVPGMRFRLIPPGRFVAGTPAEEVERWYAGNPPDAIADRVRGEAPRPVEIDAPFYLGTTEIPVAQFRRFVDAQPSPYVTTAERPDGSGFRLAADGTWRIEPGGTWRSAGAQPLSDEHPVCNLGRDECADFCRWLAVHLRGRYDCRLPTEVEWEYACRAGSAGSWSCGPDPADLGPLAWFAGTVDAADARIRPVGRKAANGFGLFDMHGNLEEWCTTAPPTTGAVLRGGHVRSPAIAVRSAVREPAAPTTPRGGFRAVLIPKAE